LEGGLVHEHIVLLLFCLLKVGHNEAKTLGDVEPFADLLK
jgi:hypothetical protein